MQKKLLIFNDKKSKIKYELANLINLAKEYDNSIFLNKSIEIYKLFLEYVNESQN